MRFAIVSEMSGDAGGYTEEWELAFETRMAQFIIASCRVVEFGLLPEDRNVADQPVYP